MRLDLSALTFGVFVVAPTVWFAMDRAPPYVRESGEMVAMAPEACQLDPAESPRGITAGACVGPQWKVRSIRQCDPAPGYPVTRHLIQSTGNRVPLGTAKSAWPEQGKGVVPGGAATLRRNFVLPYNTPEGPTEYEADACFVCNPLQQLFPSYLAVCVTEPRIKFNVSKPNNSLGLR